MNFVVYDVTGKITGCGTCPESIVQLQAMVGEFVLEGRADDRYEYVKDGVITPMPPQPSPAHIFDYTTKQWFDPRTEQDYLNDNRAQRNALLLACDWTQLPDVPAVTQLAWSAYRQALRDITNQSDQTNVIWPVSP